MAADAVLVLDCGATNLRAIAVSGEGRILASRALPNAASQDPANGAWRIWDHDRIWRDLCECAGGVAREVGPGRLGAVTVTTFGVDGTLVDADGTPRHPVISWQCERTREVMDAVEAVLPAPVLYGRSGLQPFAFNTLYKLAWLKAKRPGLLEGGRWLFISDLFLHRMTGEWATDATMAGTSMLTDLATRNWSADTLGALGLDAALFPPLVEAGSIVGTLRPRAATELGLAPGLPVVSAGHDTQFALFGSGATEGEPVLSSGTWEILMVRTRGIEAGESLRAAGVTVEWDAAPGLLNPAAMWIASGRVEWLRKLAFGELAGDAAYEAMITEATAAGSGAGGLRFSGDVLEGLGLDTTRGQLARAIFEGLALRTREALEVLEEAGRFRARRLLCVGGGARNRLWNQLRADVLGCPVALLSEKETTVIGAACFALSAVGTYTDPSSALVAFDRGCTLIEPGPGSARLPQDRP